jgi:metallo-beta-lactamase family protein
MLPDSAHIQEMEVEHLNRRNAQRGRPAVEPIYTHQDAAACMTLFRGLEYGAWTEVAAGIRARFWNAGHLLGSASVEIEINRPDAPLCILFSGDLGPGHKLLQTDPEGPADIDYLICESTYGDRERPDISPEQRRSQLRDTVHAAVEAGGPLIIPSFAVERTQELLVDLYLLMKAGEMPSAPVFVDSPLATRASAIFELHADEIEQGDVLRQALHSKELRFTETVEQSKAINRLTGFFVVIAASGMCDAGRIRHHLKANLWRRNATVMMAGYQAQGSLGRILLDGARRVRIQGEEVEVKARIGLFDLYSGHADAGELVAWVKAREPVRQAVFLTHGEQTGLDGLRERLRGFIPDDRIIVPGLDDAFRLTRGGGIPLELNEPRRLGPEKVARLDWHNDLSRLLLDINEAVAAAADERGRAAVIRRMRRALEESGA